MKTVVIYSGGMDSFTVLNLATRMWAPDEILALSFNYGQRHARELSAATRACDKLGVHHQVIPLQGVMQASALTADIDVPEGHYESANMKKTVVPARNMIMLSVAVGVAETVGADRVWFGAHAGDHAVYPDCRPEFAAAMNNAAREGTYRKVMVEAPFILKNKGEILKVGLHMGIRPEAYGDTWTCYKGGAKACGKCGACVERLEAFADAGITDPMEYAHDH